MRILIFDKNNENIENNDNCKTTTQDGDILVLSNHGSFIPSLDNNIILIN